jgi:hypothetical protein
MPYGMGGGCSRAQISCSAISAWRCSQASPTGPYIGTTRSPPPPHHRDHLAVGGDLLLQRPGRHEIQAGAHLRVGDVGVGAAAAGACGQAGRAHQHGEQALDPGERAVSAAAEGAMLRRDVSPTKSVFLSFGRLLKFGLLAGVSTTADPIAHQSRAAVADQPAQAPATATPRRRPATASTTAPAGLSPGRGGGRPRRPPPGWPPPAWRGCWRRARRRSWG